MADLIKLDLGCGTNKKPGFLGVDSIAFPGVDLAFDLRNPWIWGNESVSEVNMSHTLEHFTAMERVHIANELYRVLIPSGTATITVPHWCSMRAFGDPTHQWPPVSEFWFYYLSKDWRNGNGKDAPNAPHTDSANLPGGFSCDFDFTLGYGMHPHLAVRPMEFQQFALQFYKEAAFDIIATIRKRGE